MWKLMGKFQGKTKPVVFVHITAGNHSLGDGASFLGLLTKYQEQPRSRVVTSKNGMQTLSHLPVGGRRPLDGETLWRSGRTMAFPLSVGSALEADPVLSEGS